MAAPRVDPMACEDISAFKESLRIMRKVDDNIIHALNTTIPTASFADKTNVTDQCKDLYNQMMESHAQREKAIRNCMESNSEELQHLKKLKEKDPDNFEVLKDLKKSQTKFRLFQNELNIEEVIKDRSAKVFYERCRFFYKPDDLKI